MSAALEVKQEIPAKDCAMKRTILIAVILSLATALLAQEPTTDPWEKWDFLLGKWVGEGTSEVGHGGGYFTFEKALNGKALIRKNLAQYPATKERAAVTHEDLMIVFRDPQTKEVRAFYTDTEGNVIHYGVTLSPDQKTVTFLSEASTAGPRYRLTYVRTQPDRMDLTFEIAQPGKPEEFHKFIEGKVQRAAANN
jgi:hypothetical protein